MSAKLKSTNAVFVHGLFGWGPGELGEVPYWGDALQQIGAGFSVHEAKCGPISSFHDRACELFAQIAGGTVDYGAEHSAQAGHARHSRTYTKGFVESWSAENPVVLIGHGAGAQTCLQLQTLLARDFWGRGTSADWIEAVVSVAGVLNGSLLTYGLCCDKRSGLLTARPSQLIRKALDFIERFAALPAPLAQPFDLLLDQWTLGTENQAESIARLDNGPFLRGQDNLGFDLTLQGCLKANVAFHTHPNTYYLSLVTEITNVVGWFGLPWPGARLQPDATINPILLPAALYQAQEIEFAEPPIESWGAGDLSLDEWRRNDGVVSAISQRYPFTAHPEPVGGTHVFARSARIERGKWYYEYLNEVAGRFFDHFDPVIGSRRKPWMHEPHRLIYRLLGDTLRGVHNS
jgi:triacylglycerol lipase